MGGYIDIVNISQIQKKEFLQKARIKVKQKLKEGTSGKNGAAFKKYLTEFVDGDMKKVYNHMMNLMEKLYQDVIVLGIFGRDPYPDIFYDIMDENEIQFIESLLNAKIISTFEMSSDDTLINVNARKMK